MKNKKIDEILERETKGLNINESTKDSLCFSYNDVEEMLNELQEYFIKGLKNEKQKD